MKPKIYIAGKITGDPDYKEKFFEMESKYIWKGYTVLNPATLPEGMAPGDYMRICFALIDTADLVAFMKDCDESEGAKLEYNYCRYIGKPIITE